ncbi:hypothetical protein EYF80_010648 [Liparis tanakae]|uniref:Uncharacterized protein n=1 Tax=Liparis tanakae TaxID=230148 RepID=A0A4Z2ILR4_9TELE|nr:hypothetical protein EYF80_010648 [Liparis tanakae]
MPPVGERLRRHEPRADPPLGANEAFKCIKRENIWVVVKVQRDEIRLIKRLGKTPSGPELPAPRAPYCPLLLSCGKQRAEERSSTESTTSTLNHRGIAVKFSSKVFSRVHTQVKLLPPFHPHDSSCAAAVRLLGGVELLLLQDPLLALPAALLFLVLAAPLLQLSVLSIQVFFHLLMAPLELRGHGHVVKR